MDRFFATAGCALGFLSVACGAFAAHALRARLGPDRLAIFEVGVRYHAQHSLAMLAVAACYHVHPSKMAAAAGWAFLVGTVLFSGSLYVLAITNVRLWGAVTPFGGVGFLIGWICLGLAARHALAPRGQGL